MSEDQDNRNEQQKEPESRWIPEDVFWEKVKNGDIIVSDEVVQCIVNIIEEA